MALSVRNQRQRYHREMAKNIWRQWRGGSMGMA